MTITIPMMIMMMVTMTEPLSARWARHEALMGTHCPFPLSGAQRWSVSSLETQTAEGQLRPRPTLYSQVAGHDDPLHVA